MEDSETPPTSPTWDPRSPKLFQGFLLTAEFEKKTSNLRDRDLYFKPGLTHEVHRWLRANVGERCENMQKWDEGEGDWIYLGSQNRKRKTSNGIKPYQTFTMRFRNKAHALIFKLTWGGSL